MGLCPNFVSDIEWVWADSGPMINIHCMICLGSLNARGKVWTQSPHYLFLISFILLSQNVSLLSEIYFYLLIYLLKTNMNKETSQWNHNSGILRHAPELVPQRRLIDPSTLVRYSWRFFQAHWCYNDKTTEFISLMLKKTVVVTLK